jgi:hypothetical protein
MRYFAVIRDSALLETIAMVRRDILACKLFPRANHTGKT